MTDFSSAIAAPSRTLSIRATLTLLTGYVYTLSGDDILSYALSEGATGGDMLLGSALSAHGTLTLSSPNGAWKKGGSLLGNRTLLGATVQIEIGVLCAGEMHFEPAGSFIVSRIEGSEGEDRVTLSGYDQLMHVLAPAFTDTLTYPCTLESILSAIAQQAGCTLTGEPLCNRDTLISEMPDWGDGCSLRQALAWTAGAMGCFVRMSREGEMQLIPLKKASARSLSAENAFSMTLEDTLFSFNRLRVMPRGGRSGQYTEYALDETLPYGADNTLTIDDNPLFRSGSSELQTLAQTLCQALEGLMFSPFELAFPGDPTLQVGDFITLTALDGAASPALLFSSQLQFHAGLTQNIACDLETSGVSLPRIVTSAGKLSSAALTDGIIAARHIAAGAIDAEKISARAINANHIALGTITSDSGLIGQLSADSITAGKLSTDRLIVGGSEFSIVRALNQLANSLSQNDQSIDGDVISDKTVSPGKVTDDFGAGLELSSNAAVLLLAGKLDGSNSHMELTQEAINMVGGEINIATNDLQIRGMDDGGEIMSLDPEGLSAPRVTVTEDFSAPHVIFSHPGNTAAWKGGIQSSLDALPKFLTQDTTLTIPAGTYMEDVRVEGYLGNQLTLHFSPDTVLQGSISLIGCSTVVLEANTLGDAAIYPPDPTAPPVVIRSCQSARLNNLRISGYRGRTTADDGTDSCVYVLDSHVRLSSCCLEYSGKHCCVLYRSTFHVQDCIGGCEGSDPATNANLGHAVLAYEGSHGGVGGNTVPMSIKDCVASLGTVYKASTLTKTPGGMTYVPPEYVTKTFAISRHCTYLYGERRISDSNSSHFSQGRYGEYTSGDHYWRTGAIWFAQASELLKNKTIRRASLTLRRASGGWSDARPVYLGTVKLAESDYDSTLKPTFTAAGEYPITSIKREVEVTLDVTDLMPAIQAGHAFGVYEPRSQYDEEFSPDYSKYYGKGSQYEPMLTVEYK